MRVKIFDEKTQIIAYTIKFSNSTLYFKWLNQYPFGEEWHGTAAIPKIGDKFHSETLHLHFWQWLCIACCVLGDDMHIFS